MKNIKLKAKLDFCLSRIFNLIFRTIFNRFIFILGSFVYLFFIFEWCSLNIKIISIVSLGFALNFRRVSETFNLNLITGCLNMSLNDPSEYWKYSYISQREIIAKFLKQEFISGIINASKYRKKLKMSTHKWMIQEVISSEKIKSNFDIEIIKKKKFVNLSAEVLILIGKVEFKKSLYEIYEIAKRERESFDVILKKKL